MKTLDEYLLNHLDRMRALNYSRYTIRQSRYCVAVFLAWVATTHAVFTTDQLRATHLQAWQQALARRTTLKGLPLKARSVNKHVETLNSFLKFMAENGAAPRALSTVLRYVKEPCFLPGSVLTHEQMSRLLTAVSTDTPDGYRLRTMLEVLYSTGMRVAELLGLDLGDLDLPGSTAKVLGKGSKERMVPLGRTAVHFLESYIRAVRATGADGQQQAVFLDGAGRRFPYYTFRRLVKTCAARAGLPADVTPHTFRRSCTTELLRGGANMYHVKDLLGHESLETLKHYARLTITDLKATHEKCHPREREETQ